jgi:hypothetical protein
VPARSCSAARSPAEASRTCCIAIMARPSRTRGWRARARCPASAWSTVSPTRPGEGEAGKAEPVDPGGVPGRGLPPRHRVPGRAERPVRRAVRAGRVPAGASTPRPARRRSAGSPPAGRTGRPRPRCWPARSAGRSPAGSPGPRPSRWKETRTPSIPPSRDGASSSATIRYAEFRVTGPMVSRALCGELVVRGHRTRYLALPRMHNCPQSESSEERHQGVWGLVAPRLGRRRAGAGESAFFDRQIAVEVHADGRLNLLVA